MIKFEIPINCKHVQMLIHDEYVTVSKMEEVGNIEIFNYLDHKGIEHSAEMGKAEAEKTRKTARFCCG